jgi:predicted nucleic acid-binding protein
LLTHDYVLAEFVPLSQSRGLNREQTLSFIRDLLESPLVEVIWTGAEMYRRAIELLGQRLDKTYSLCDAVSFLLMRDRQISEALTTDRHFAQEGFTRLLQP